MKKIICYLFHRTKFLGHNFRDIVNGREVFNYHCKRCKRTFMAHSRFSTFRVTLERERPFTPNCIVKFNVL